MEHYAITEERTIKFKEIVRYWTHRIPPDVSNTTQVKYVNKETNHFDTDD